LRTSSSRRTSSRKPAPLEERPGRRTAYLVVIEPALKESTRKLMNWRDDMGRPGIPDRGPCIGTAVCPMLERDDLWCHQDVPGRGRDASPRSTAASADQGDPEVLLRVITRRGDAADLAGDVARVRTSTRRRKAWAGSAAARGRSAAARSSRAPVEATAAFFRADRATCFR
jgi:hypothetical protein